MWESSCLVFISITTCVRAAHLHTQTDLGSFKTVMESFNVVDQRPMNTSQLIVLYGHPVEDHTALTADGYLLTLFRIPGKGPSVLIVHGLFLSSDDFLTLGEKSLPIKLATLGYDVWLGNVRGNQYSRKHTTISPDDKIFWNFSWHEIGVYDCPAMIDYILKCVGINKLAYIGHSQGTTAAYVMLSEKVEYNEKVNIMVSLASVSYMSHLESPLVQALAKMRETLKIVLETFHMYELLPHRPPTSTVMAFCASSEPLSILCLSLQFYLYGYDFEQIDLEHLRSQLTHVPSGSSWMQVLHYLQNVESGQFQKYEHDPSNLANYNYTISASYAVQDITTNMAFIYSDNDWLSNFSDVRKLIDKLKHVVDVHKVAFQGFNHIDYVWAKNADDLVYSKVIGLLNKFSNSSL